MSKEGWIGVDLDRTLAHYDKWVSETHIGAPIPLMLARVKKWIDDGKDVRIFTARVSGERKDPEGIKIAIQRWCLDHIGVVLKITCEKDRRMLELYDDRAVQVEANTGKLIGYSTR